MLIYFTIFLSTAAAITGILISYKKGTGFSIDWIGKLSISFVLAGGLATSYITCKNEQESDIQTKNYEKVKGFVYYKIQYECRTLISPFVEISNTESKLENSDSIGFLYNEEGREFRTNFNFNDTVTHWFNGGIVSHTYLDFISDFYAIFTVNKLRDILNNWSTYIEMDDYYFDRLANVKKDYLELNPKINGPHNIFAYTKNNFIFHNQTLIILEKILINSNKYANKTLRVDDIYLDMESN